MTRAKGPAFVVPYRRRREGKTNFTKRLALIKSGQPRMVVRKSNCDVLVQFIHFDPKGDKTFVSVSGKQLAKEFKWPHARNTWTAYLVGFKAARMAKSKGVEKFVLDTGRYTPSKGSLMFAALKGAADSGMKVDFDSEKVLEDKINNPPEKVKTVFQQIKKQLAG